MPIENGYVGLEAVKKAMGAKTTTDDGAIEQAIATASRQIDNFCGRRFWRDPSARVAYIEVGHHRSSRRLRLGGQPEWADVVIDGITEVAYSYRDTPDEWNVTTQYLAIPTDPKWDDVTNTLRATGSLRWPAGGLVRITATFGIDGAPDPVVTAATLQAERNHKRTTDSVMGSQIVVQGQAPVTVPASRYPDGDIQQWLAGYARRWWD